MEQRQMPGGWTSVASTRGPRWKAGSDYHDPRMRARYWTKVQWPPWRNPGQNPNVMPDSLCAVCGKTRPMPTAQVRRSGTSPMGPPRLAPGRSGETDGLAHHGCSSAFLRASRERVVMGIDSNLASALRISPWEESHEAGGAQR